jgi:hypothetical protein
MNLDVNFMALLIVNYSIIQLLKMERIYIYSKCYIEHDMSTYVKYVVFQSPTYMKTFLSKHPFSIQLLLFKNIGLHIQKKIWGFNTCEIIDSSLLNSPLLS